VRGITPAIHRYSPRRHAQGNLPNQNGELPRRGRGSGMFWKFKRERDSADNWHGSETVY
jgi:hypothetical protein